MNTKAKSRKEKALARQVIYNKLSTQEKLDKVNESCGTHQSLKQKSKLLNLLEKEINKT